MQKIKQIIILSILIMMFFICPIRSNAYAYDMPEGETKMDKDLRSYIEKICDEYGINPDLIVAMAELESQLKYDDVSSSGCIGLCQISPKWHSDRMKKLGVTDLYDPYQNALVAVDFVSALYKEYNDTYAVLMFYNAGYSEKIGIKAWKNGKKSHYALDIVERADVLGKLREEREIKMESAKIGGIKRVLMQYRDIKSLIADLSRQILEMQNELGLVKSAQMTGMPRGGVPVTFADKISDLDDLERRKEKFEILALQKKEIVQSYIDTVISAKHNRFLTSYFIKGNSIYSIAKKEHYTTRHAFRVYKEALEMVDLSLDL